ncbi:monocarboxylate transporter 5-like isoform X2 [Portunus trituberculatus]|uniref:monocarboxylate transporter 5-like isoform X2 n=1 Tax=Portunus trituberculatus TaxID=210409 RepID=UPI001E1D022E|nr:monocarboxylate transporter 5-like isoform X2 [Portunus trituberculatus]
MIRIFKVFSPSVTLLDTNMDDSHTPAKDPSSEPAKFQFQIGASDEEFDEPEVEIVVATHVVPPDGGWGWVVVAASFMCNAVVDGIIFSCGMLLHLFKEEFGVSTSDVAWVSSLLGGFYLIVGPFVSALANAYGFRTVCILGGVISSVAFGISSFATSIYYLQFTFGIVGGIGFGLIYVPAVIATGFYFEKRRALATGIAVCGSGIGTFIFAALNSFLIPSFGWRWTLVVYAGITLSCVVFGLAFRPLKPTTKFTTDDLEPPGTPLLMRIKRARDEQMKQCASALSMTSMNSKTPSRANLEEPFYDGEPGKMATNKMVAKTLLERHGGNMHKRYSFPGIVVTSPEPIKEETETPLIECSDGVKEDVNKQDENRVLDDNKNETQMKNEAKETEANGTIPNYNPENDGTSPCPRNKSAPVLAQTNLLSVEHLRRPSKLALRTETARPFYRDDIFYSGSMCRLPQYKSSESVEKYHQSVTQLPPMKEIVEEEEERNRCKCCPVSITNIISRMFDLSLLSSPTFIMLGLAGFMSLMALFIPFMFLPGYAEQQGISENSIATLVSTIGITNTIGRIVCGWVSDHPKVDALYVNNFSLMLGGGATMLLPMIVNESLLLAYSVAFGLSVAAFASLRSILLVELLGLEKLTNAFGLLLLFQGIAGIFGSPVAGAFVDLTKTYDISFYVFGGLFALSGVMCIPLRYIKEWEEKRNKRKHQECNAIEMKA